MVVLVSFINFVARLFKKYKSTLNICTVYSTFPQESTAQQHEHDTRARYTFTMHVTSIVKLCYTTQQLLAH